MKVRSVLTDLNPKERGDNSARYPHPFSMFFFSTKVLLELLNSNPNLQDCVHEAITCDFPLHSSGIGIPKGHSNCRCLHNMDYIGSGYINEFDFLYWQNRAHANSNFESLAVLYSPCDFAMN